eukprot:augustus_masked-scaffold_3-processed-gene-10.5-mRNA-1 protein AED:1.00 eAED:1.00 QI:0/-1/0/0/-1/1/1/0/81
MWTGPYQFVKILSPNVYEILSPLGKRKTRHAAYLKWYDGAEMQMKENIKKQFVHDYGELEVKKFEASEYDEGAKQYFLELK